MDLPPHPGPAHDPLAGLPDAPEALARWRARRTRALTLEHKLRSLSRLLGAVAGTWTGMVLVLLAVAASPFQTLLEPGLQAALAQLFARLDDLPPAPALGPWSLLPDPTPTVLGLFLVALAGVTTTLVAGAVLGRLVAPARARARCLASLADRLRSGEAVPPAELLDPDLPRAAALLLTPVPHPPGLAATLDAWAADAGTEAERRLEAIDAGVVPVGIVLSGIALVSGWLYLVRGLCFDFGG